MMAVLRKSHFTDQVLSVRTHSATPYMTSLYCYSTNIALHKSEFLTCCRIAKEVLSVSI